METPSLSALFFDEEALGEAVVSAGGRPFHVRILRERVLSAGALDYAEMTSLPAALRETFAERHPILAGQEVSRSVASDRTTKLLLSFSGAREGTVETVHIPAHSPTSTKGATLCVSTQIGCPVACPFCASGKLGLVRNLHAHEIVEQYLRGRALGELSRSVVMGIGEPLLNWEAVSAALRVVHEELGMGARKITVSTVGFPDRVRRAAETNPPFQLAISLHTPFDEERAELVPAMQGTPIAEVVAAGARWFEVTGREVTYEYVLLGGVNDSPTHARALVVLLSRHRCTINLIPFNPIEESPYRRPRPDGVEAFRAALEDAGLVATVRWSRGMESDAACGQLRLRSAASGG